jgi:hypothetical protein
MNEFRTAVASRQGIQIASEGWKTANRLGITIRADCDKQLARTYIDAGCIWGQDAQLLASFLGSLRHWLLRVAGRMPKARIKSKLPIEIVVRADERHHTSVRKARTHASRRASEAPVSPRAVAVIRPAPIIIALHRSFATCLANARLHASRYLSARCPTGLLPNRRLLGSGSHGGSSRNAA